MDRQPLVGLLVVDQRLAFDNPAMDAHGEFIDGTKDGLLTGGKSNAIHAVPETDTRKDLVPMSIAVGKGSVEKGEG
jgi:hypothetical protein